MRKLFSFILVFLVLFSFSACKEKSKTETKTPITINIPKDNSVNGYRIKEPEKIDNNRVDANSVRIEKPSDSISNNSSTNSKGKYCININSNIFHKLDCASVGKMKEENKLFSSDRNRIISEGNKPCKSCNP